MTIRVEMHRTPWGPEFYAIDGISLALSAALEAETACERIEQDG